MNTLNAVEYDMAARQKSYRMLGCSDTVKRTTA